MLEVISYTTHVVSEPCPRNRCEPILEDRYRVSRFARQTDFTLFVLRFVGDIVPLPTVVVTLDTSPCPLTRVINHLMWDTLPVDLTAIGISPRLFPLLGLRFSLIHELLLEAIAWRSIPADLLPSSQIPLGSYYSQGSFLSPHLGQRMSRISACRRSTSASCRPTWSRNNLSSASSRLIANHLARKFQALMPSVPSHRSGGRTPDFPPGLDMQIQSRSASPFGERRP